MSAGLVPSEPRAGRGVAGGVEKGLLRPLFLHLVVAGNHRCPRLVISAFTVMRSPWVWLAVPQFPPRMRTWAHLLTSFHLIIPVKTLCPKVTF